jgi:hypothetical protein
MKTALLDNWQTTAAGAIVIVVGFLHTYYGVNVPGMDMSFIQALPIGAGLILAKDAGK